MNYPIWELTSTGGAFWVALISISHVFISHLAVGGGLFLVLTEIKAHRNSDARLMDYVKRHTLFFLLLTMVFGGLSGVGIWFIIALVSPAATSALIHNFVFGWAIEWVFFIGEIVALLIYHYRFGKMNTKDHIKLGWLYFIFAWLSLFIINGILDFMLTPGRWLETGNFWLGFFNPTYLPSLIFRSGVAFMLAGMFGLVTAVFTKDPDFRMQLYRYNVQWMLLPFVVIIISGAWYLNAIPEIAYNNILNYNPSAAKYIDTVIVTSIVIFILAGIFLVRLPSMFQKIAVFLLLVVGFGWIGGFEYTREIARKPYLIFEHMYSNSVYKSDVAMYNEQGYLQHAKWTTIKAVTDENMVEAGWELFKFQCLSCHTIDGYNQILNKTDRFTERGLVAHLTGQGKVNTYMPPFMGTEKEKAALAAYIYRDLHGNTPVKEGPADTPDESPYIPAFNDKKDEYVLLVWNDLGMHCISDNDKYWTFLPPANTLWAQLIKRGPKPEIITDAVEMTYKPEEGYMNPEDQVPFWDYVSKNFGADLEPGVGLAGNKVTGHLHENILNTFVAHHIPVVPYKDDGTFNPYPIFDVEAKDANTGELLAMTRAVAPTSTEMGCRNCHQGGWRWNNIAGTDDLTSINILKAHDRMNGTSLLEDAENGNPHLCQSCHADPALGATGKPEIMNFSSSIHGFHANYLSDLKEDDACYICHPADERGTTLCMRGRHRQVGLNCTHCHGTIQDHAIGLLKHEQALGKPSADRLLANLNPVVVESIDQVNGRMPWLNEPDCMSCHTNFDIKALGMEPTAHSGYNKWVAGGSALYRNRADNQGVMCAACHGSPHAIYAATNIYGDSRDNIQPLMYQGVAGTIGTQNNCKVCHTIDMDVNGHHRNMVK
jgi:mono/diheme cytochrome c family protein